MFPFLSTGFLHSIYFGGYGVTLKVLKVPTSRNGEELSSISHVSQLRAFDFFIADQVYFLATDRFHCWCVFSMGAGLSDRNRQNEAANSER